MPMGQREKQPPQMIEEKTQMKAMLGLVNGLVTTRNTRGVNPPLLWGARSVAVCVGYAVC